MMGRNAAEASRRSRPWRPRGRAVRYSVPEQQEHTSGYEPVWVGLPAAVISGVRFPARGRAKSRHLYLVRLLYRIDIPDRESYVGVI
jgi:hypothetical protein